MLIDVSVNSPSISATVASGNNVSVSVGGGSSIGIDISQGLPGPKGDKGDPGDPGPFIPTGPDKAVQFNDGGVVGGTANFRYDKNTDSVIVGFPDLLTNNPLAVGGALNDFLQVTVQNTTEGDSASSDFVATADNGSDEAHYIDLGINSSVYDQAEYNATAANDGYLIVKDGDLVLDAGSTGKKVKIAAGGTTSSDIVAEFGAAGLTLPAGYPVTNRPEIYYGTGSPPDPADKPNGTLFFKYTP